MKYLRLLAALVLFVAVSSAAAAQTRVVTGQVRDAATNTPVEGATISVRGTVQFTTSGVDGAFSLAVPTGTVQLLIRQIGFKRAELTLGPGTNTASVLLEADVFQLDEIVVTGQATGIDRRNLANAVTTVSAQDIERVPATSVERAIQGKVAGANIQSNSGAPGGGIQVELRGVTSINGDAQPIYVVDGIIVSDIAIPSNINEVTDASGGSNPGLTQDNQVNRIVDLNPADIESIEVLKGASASAIYGSKASNGVIIIRTKRGQSGAPRVNVSQRFGFRDLANTLSREFATAADVDAALGDGTAALYDFDPDKSWEQDLAGSNPLSFESQVSVSGGTGSTQYFVSGAWLDQEDIMPNTGFDKQSIRINLDQALGDRLNLQVSSNIVHTLARRGISNNDNTGTSPWFAGASTPRFVDLTAGEDGVFPDNPFERSNPIQTLSLMTNDEDVWRFIGSARLEWSLVQSDQHSLRVLGTAGVDRFSQENALLFPPELQFEDDDGLPGTSLLSNSDNENINLTGNIVYGFAPLDGSFTATTSAGIQYDTRDLNTSRITTRNLLAGQANINQGSVVAVDEQRSRIEDLGFYVQEEVLVGDRLLLTGGVRADQSSVNSQDDELFVYPKGAVSYRFPVSGFFDEFKVRAAYGESGNQPLFGQKFSPLEGTVNIESILGFQVPPGTGVNGATIVTSDIKPERQREIEGGIDATFADGRAYIEATAYHKRVSDLILQRQLAPSSGFVQQVFNGGTMRINGVEAAVGLVPVQTTDFNWVLRSTFSMNRSKITSLPVPSFFPNNAGFGAGFGNGRIEVGESATQLAGNIPDGQGGATIGKVGDTNPDFRMSFSNDISAGRFNLGFLLDWQQGSQIVNLTGLLFDAANNSKDCTNGADNPCAQRLGAFGTDLGVYVEDATFLKLREISATYDIPESIAQGLWGGLRNARVSISARNWFTFTGYTGMDPEVSNFGNQSVGRNIDVAPYPRTRSIWFGLDLGF